MFSDLFLNECLALRAVVFASALTVDQPPLTAFRRLCGLYSTIFWKQMAGIQSQILSPLRLSPELPHSGAKMFASF
jgi:hypothetical protein